jgi:hypothetical protein
MRIPALAAAVALAACSEPSTTLPKAAPTVTIHPMARELLATSLKATVEVSGCDSVSRVRLRDRDYVLEERQPMGATVDLEIPVNHIPFAERGIAADLALFADATCVDGRSGTSREVPVTFMPAEELIAGPMPFGANFWIDGDSFLTCTRELVRVSKSKEVLAHRALNFDCGSDAELTIASDGSIAVVKPGLAFALFKPDLTPLLAEDAEGIEQLLVPPDPSLPLVALIDNGVVHQLQAWSRNGARSWGPVDLGGIPAGRLAYRDGRLVYPSYWLRETGSQIVDVGAMTYNLADGTQSSQQSFGMMKTDLMGPLTVPEITFDSGASTAYFADMADPSVVRACDAVNPRGCTELGQGLIWTSDPLTGGVLKAVRTDHALVAFGGQVAWFLDPANGNAIGEPATASGSLDFGWVLGGRDGSTMLLGWAPNEAGIKQVMIFDQPAQQVANYVTGTSGYIVDVDPQGRAWLWKEDMVGLYPAAQYREAL